MSGHSARVSCPHRQLLMVDNALAVRLTGSSPWDWHGSIPVKWSLTVTSHNSPVRIIVSTLRKSHSSAIWWIWGRKVFLCVECVLVCWPRSGYASEIRCVTITYGIAVMHDDFIKWKHYPRNWPFLRGIHRGPAQRPVTRSFDVFFDLRLNKRLSKQSWSWWFETLSCSLWRHCNGLNPSNSLAIGKRGCNITLTIFTLI